MTKSPLVSIVIPCFNSEKHLSETIESVREQTYSNYEVIVVDDGSSDLTKEIVKSYGDIVKPIYMEHRGPGAARNRGTEIASGEFLQYLDSDDLLTQNALEARVEKILKSNADVVYSDWQELVEVKESVFEKGEIHNNKIEDIHIDPTIALFTKFWAPPAAYLFKHSTVKSVNGFREDIYFGEDARFVFDVAENNAKFEKVDGVGAYYRKLKKGNFSKSNPKRFLQDIYINTSSVEKVWLEKGELSSEQKCALISNYDYTARNLFDLDYELFKDNLNSLYEIQPGFNFSWPKVAGALSNLVGHKSAQFIMDHSFPLNKESRQ